MDCRGGVEALAWDILIPRRESPDHWRPWPPDPGGSPELERKPARRSQSNSEVSRYGFGQSAKVTFLVTPRGGLNVTDRCGNLTQA